MMLGRVPSITPSEEHVLRLNWGKALWCCDRNRKNYWKHVIGDSCASSTIIEMVPGKLTF